MSIVAHLVEEKEEVGEKEREGGSREGEGKEDIGIMGEEEEGKVREVEEEEVDDEGGL